MKDKRLSQKQIEKLMANNPHKEQPVETTWQNVSFKGAEKEYDTLNSVEQVKTFCSFMRDVVSRFEENKRQQAEAEIEELDLKHCIELAQKLTEKDKKLLYSKLTDVLQVRRACKNENEILQPLYDYFSDKTLLNKLAQIQGNVSNIKEIITNRTYSCRTNVLDGFRSQLTE